MVYLSFLFTYLFPLSSPVHIGEVAEYKYYIQDSVVHLSFMVDIDELEDLKSSQPCDYANLLAFCTSSYVNKNATLFINDNPVEFEFESSSIRNNHLNIYFGSTTKLVDVNKISVYNNCFYNFNQNFKNRIIIDIEKYRATYLLDVESKDLNCLMHQD